MASLYRLRIFSATAASCSKRTFRHFSTTGTCYEANNRVFTSIRSGPELSNAQIIASSNNRPLITLWTASWCSNCKQVSPLIKSLIAQGVGGPGPDSNGVAYAEVEADAPDMTDTTSQFVLNSVPTLMTFVNQELVDESVIRDAKKIMNENFLRHWIEDEARRGPQMAVDGAGSWLGKLFGGSK